MASLSAHLRQASDHGRLGFHAGCPVCREERLFGALSTESVVTRRARTALLTGVVAASLTTPPAVWGQEADTRQEGVAAPHEPSGGPGAGPSGELEDPEFDPGGETDLPSEDGTPHSTPPNGVYDEDGESGPLELEPEVDPDVPPVEPDAAPPTTGQGDSDDPGAPPVGEPTPDPLPEDQAPEEPSAGKPDSGRGPAADKRVRGKSDSGKPHEPRDRPPAPQPPEPPSGQAPSAPAPVHAVPPPAPAPAPAAAQVESAPTGQVTQVAQGDPEPPPPARDGARVHVVQPGESLWVIAKRTLPPGASVARIAREVNRLWELNEERIATGDPDLLRIGTELRLR